MFQFWVQSYLLFIRGVFLFISEAFQFVNAGFLFVSFLLCFVSLVSQNKSFWAFTKSKERETNVIAVVIYNV